MEHEGDRAFTYFHSLRQDLRTDVDASRLSRDKAIAGTGTPCRKFLKLTPS